ncbi:unnamed protein product, partial [Ectocarpus fasciculatus]
AECSDVFCKACENFVVTCEFCDKEYCLICCAKKTPCVSCRKKPSRPRLIEATAQLKRVQQGFQAGEMMMPPVAPIAGPGVSTESANATAAAAKDEEAKLRAKEEERKKKLKLKEQESKAKAAELEKKKKREAAAAAAAAKKQREEEEEEEAEKKQRVAAAFAEKEAKRANDAAAAAAAAASAAAASASAAGAQVSLSQQQQQKPRGTNMMPKKAKKKKGKKKGGGGGNNAAAAATPAQAAIPIRTELPPLPPPVVAPSTPEMDHSVIKKWVLEVASRRVLATSDEIKRYFHGRVDEDVIDFYLEEFSNCRATVIQCAEFLNIEVPPVRE